MSVHWPSWLGCSHHTPVRDDDRMPVQTGKPQILSSPNHCLCFATDHFEKARQLREHSVNPQSQPNRNISIVAFAQVIQGTSTQTGLLRDCLGGRHSRATRRDPGGLRSVVRRVCVGGGHLAGLLRALQRESVQGGEGGRGGGILQDTPHNSL